jgi:hypothetical protein
MRRVTLVTGQAGTGKTTWLMDKANICAKELIRRESQRMLAITRMHGSRRRLELKLREVCHDFPYAVATIDGFALRVLNRWRTSIGCAKPIIAVSDDAAFNPTLFGVEAGFAIIASEAARLLQSPTVRKIIGTSYPLIMIDEFQDCHGSLLDFVKGLSRSSTLLLAADDFQLLDSSVGGCPAIEWVMELQANGEAEIEELEIFHRTSSLSILEAARSLRENTRSQRPTVPIICCLNYGVAAWRIVYHLALGPRAERWFGSCALISPSHDPFLQKVLASSTVQMKKKNLSPIHWNEELTHEEEKTRILQLLGVAQDTCSTGAEWCEPNNELDLISTCVVDRTRQFCKLRGMEKITIDLVEKHAEKVVHDLKAYCVQSPKRTVTTVHGAKNREFDNVFILWTYKLPPDTDQQRRWLYNAVTRSKKNCMILMLGNEKRAKEDPVLSLLGPPQPAFRQGKKV